MLWGRSRRVEPAILSPEVTLLLVLQRHWRDRGRRAKPAISSPEVTLLPVSLVPLLQYNPSEIAGASLILSVKCMKKMHAWNKEMETVTGYSDAHLAPIVEEVKGFALEVNPKFLTTLKYKFSKQEYMEVASITLKF